MILVVDDSPPIRDLTRTILESAGYPVKEAFDAASALAALDGVRLALVDVELGAESGFDLAKRLSPLAVVLVSGHDMPGVSYLRKPFTPDSLLDAVRQKLKS